MAEWEEVRRAAPEVVVVDAVRLLRGAGRRGDDATTRDRLAPLGAERVVAVDAAAYFSRPGPRLVDGSSCSPTCCTRSASRRRRSGARSSSTWSARAPAAETPRRSSGEPPPRAPNPAQIGSWPPPAARARLSGSSNSTSAASAPPIRPPMCPPTEMLGIEKVNTRLSPIQNRRRDAIGRCRACACTTTPRPSARTPRRRRRRCVVGWSSRRRTSPPSSDTKKIREAHAPDRGLQHRAEEVEREHVESRWEARVQEPAVTSRQYSPVGDADLLAEQREVAEQAELQPMPPPVPRSPPPATAPRTRSHADAHEDVGQRSACRRRPAARALHLRALARALRAAHPDRRRGHAVRADRPPAVRAARRLSRGSGGGSRSPRETISSPAARGAGRALRTARRSGPALGRRLRPARRLARDQHRVGAASVVRDRPRAAPVCADLKCGDGATSPPRLIQTS